MTTTLTPPSIDAALFRTVMAEFPTFVTVVTAPGPDGPIGCTANAVMSLSLDPPSIIVSLAERSRTALRVMEHGVFGVNVLTWRQRELTRQFATGEPCRRFDDVPYGRRHGVPMLDGAAAGVVCVLEQQISAHDHMLLIGRVVEATTGPEEAALIYHRNGQHTLRVRP